MAKVNDPTCVNCTYEVSELTKEGLCETCWRAYEAGREYEQAQNLKEVNI